MPGGAVRDRALAEAALRERGVRERVSIDVYTPEPAPMPTAGPVVGRALEALLSERGIHPAPERTVASIEPRSRDLVFTDGEREPYDLLLEVPPHRAPGGVSRIGLAGDGGFLPVDPHTLAAKADRVFDIGDATQIPIAGGRFLPKAGVFPTAEAKVVARRIAREVAGRPPRATFDGNGSCFVETGAGKAVHATGDFYEAEGPRIRLHHAGRRGHLAKVGLERRWMRGWFRR